ncbi:hypothetical protein [uncultured Gimesia sp.]|uniref:hypothetical protein n=1 Tax=uncultured Gimesia sp. TaxID=1678688 RepID=UPI0030DAA14B|tara:strand:+ start:3544 stop:4299 length:756 start_codon:yes stop_codon:yes gene_type:complete
MKGKWIYIVASILFVVLWIMTSSEFALKQPSTWQRLAEPGQLSAAHAHLENNCAACHTSVTGIQTSKCIVCHANNESLLQRQPTSFHASISSCKECHLEHQGRGKRATSMDHVMLAKIGLRQLKDDDINSELMTWSKLWVPPHANITPDEVVLNCATCHSNDDQHFQLFGQDCAQCHATDKWTIAEFRHPSPNSMDCAQCHQAPPSHYMMHFKMISARVAGRPHARVDQCFQCHQTTSWNDILGAGWYKHH